MRVGHRSRSRADERIPKSGFLFVLRTVADDVGDIVVALFLLLNERSFLGLLDLDVVVALCAFGGLGLRALRLGVGDDDDEV